MNYNESLNYIYDSFMSVKKKIAGKYDREVRNPNIILELAHAMDVLPDKSRVIKVTGSKGKGTVTRLISAHLVNSGSKNVGMLVSPEEIEHYDRIRIDGTPMSEKIFVRVFNSILSFLEARKKRLNDYEYLSPSGIFLLIALKWFKENGVKHFVLECGRGAKYDEVGNIQSYLSVVSSILFEHPSYLGPTLEDIAKDKLSIANTSEKVVLAPLAKDKSNSLGLQLNEVLLPLKLKGSTNAPSWYILDEQLAVTAVKSYLKTLGEDFNKGPIDFESASYGKRQQGSITMFYEALVSKRSFDEAFINLLIEKYKTVLFVASLPDDKDLEAIQDYLSSKKQTIKHVILTGTRGYLHYDRTEKLYRTSILAKIEYHDKYSLREYVCKEIINKDINCIYFFGTHTFIRLIKNSFFTSEVSRIGGSEKERNCA